MTITTEEIELLAQTHDLARFTLGMKAPEHDLTAAGLRALAAERDALRAENARLREALDMAKTMLQTGMPEYDANDALDVIRAALGETQ
jgi:hypothetical protein